MFRGVIELWAYAETVAVGREKQKLRRAPTPPPPDVPFV